MTSEPELLHGTKIGVCSPWCYQRPHGCPESSHIPWPCWHPRAVLPLSSELPWCHLGQGSCRCWLLSGPQQSWRLTASVPPTRHLPTPLGGDQPATTWLGTSHLRLETCRAWSQPSSPGDPQQIHFIGAMTRLLNQVFFLLPPPASRL